MTDIRLVQLHGSVFMAGLVVQDKVKLAESLNEAASHIFDGDTAVLPIPEDAAPEIPRIILRSKAGNKLLQLSLKRLDLVFLLTGEGAEPIAFPNPDLSRLLLAVRGVIASAAASSFSRAALISNWVVALDRPGREFIRSRYLRDGSPAERAIEVEIHALEKSPVAGCDSNQWVRVQTAKKVSAPEDDRYLAVLVDINTSTEKTHDFAGDLLARFLDEGQALIGSLMAKHLGERR